MISNRYLLDLTMHVFRFLRLQFNRSTMLIHLFRIEWIDLFPQNPGQFVEAAFRNRDLLSSKVPTLQGWGRGDRGRSPKRGDLRPSKFLTKISESERSKTGHLFHHQKLVNLRTLNWSQQSSGIKYKTHLSIFLFNMMPLLTIHHRSNVLTSLGIVSQT